MSASRHQPVRTVASPVRPDVADAETAGFESIWVADHLVVPAEIRTPFPYAPDGNSGMSPGTQIFDSWVLLSFIAAATQRLRLATYVYILPLRHPFVTAKAAASLQILSGGRLLLGAGVGWLTEEYTAMDLPFARRGRDTAEGVEIMRRLWTDDLVTGEGPAFAFDAVGIAPRPPSIPIHLGGHSPAAIGRATRIGDGWLGSPRPADVLAEHLAEMRGLVHAGLERAGRDRAGFEITGAVLGLPGRETFARAAEAGLHRLIVSPWAGAAEPPSPERVAAQLCEIVAVAAELDAVGAEATR